VAKEKVTAWIDPSIKPTIIGWYERKYSCEWMIADRDWWDGKRFILSKGGIGETPAAQDLPWRGLAAAASNENGQRGSEA
jgi:hypothetical protein